MTEKTWVDLHNEKRPGETYDNLIQRLLDETKEYRFLKDMERIIESDDFIPLEQVDRRVT